MRLPNPHTYALFPAAWLVIAGVGCLAGAAAEGADSILPNFAIHGLGVGAVIAVLAALAYARDVRLHRGK